jgi:hypothetical protein
MAYENPKNCGISQSKKYASFGGGKMGTVRKDVSKIIDNQAMIMYNTTRDEIGCPNKMLIFKYPCKINVTHITIRIRFCSFALVMLPIFEIYWTRSMQYSLIK